MAHIFFLIALTLNGQNKGYIVGKLLDGETKDPIIYATIQIKNLAVGTISNIDGGFKIPDKYFASKDTLIISCIGYEQIEISITTLTKTEVNKLELTPKVIELSEAIIIGKRRKRLSARQIVQKAIDAIPNNYPQKPFSTIGYYRDYQLDENEYLNLNEAILEVFDSGFNKVDHETSEVRIYEYIENPSFRKNDFARQQYNYKTGKKVIDKVFLSNYGGNEFTILRIHDAIRNHQIDAYDFVNVLGSDLLRNHEFSKGEDTFLDTEPLYAITFDKTLAGFRAYGLFYISKNDFAIHRMEYALYDSSKRNFGKKINKHHNYYNLIFEVITEYKRFEGKMIPNYVSLQNTFELKTPPKFKLDSLNIDLANQRFVLDFNSPPRKSDAQNLGKYRVKFKNKRIRFKKAEVINSSIMLYPEMDEVEASVLFDELHEISKTQDNYKNLIDIKISKMENIDGHELDKWTKKNYNQFREFFAQKIRLNLGVTIDGLNMKKNRPLFDNIVSPKPSYLDNYWMNTPLQKTID
ncbi:carboxypeptidase-like regulatory domain-containing protein [Flagellimonas sp.]|uniref:carboxypeptidase-like regulatory domain-containing protein n=1 Tax=Flagellimonas sp. TaxID=2058762 RepID=UPI003B5125C1